MLRTAMHVNWFSPLPPERTGIAEFTAEVAPELRRRATVRFIAQRSTEECAIADAVPLDRLSLRDINSADCNVFNLGNNAAFHARLWSASTCAGGIVILHDARFQDLFHGIFANERQRFFDTMRGVYGISGEAGARLCADGRLAPHELAEHFPLVELALAGAKGAIVHSAEAERVVRERVDIPLLTLPLPLDPLDAPTRRTRAAPGERLNILAFGHLGPNRRIDSVLTALAVAAPKLRFRFDIVGDVSNDQALRAKARELGIAQDVFFRGHVSSSALEEYLSSADLVINLRWPTMGEASYSQLRAFRHGVATMVSRAGWYAELPEEAVFHVDPAREVEDIARLLATLHANPGRLRDIGERGRQVLVEKHGSAHYVEALLAFAREQARSARPIEEMLAHRVSGVLAGMSKEAVDMCVAAVGARVRAVATPTLAPPKRTEPTDAIEIT